MKQSRKRRLLRWYVLKELVLTVLALLSVGLVVYELAFNPSAAQHRLINHADFGIACLFLFDFCLELRIANDKRRYWRRNWYFLLAAIPITDSWTEALRGLRILRVLRLLRAGEHVDFDVITHHSS